jgi:hypothetical protein
MSESKPPLLLIGASAILTLIGISIAAIGGFWIVQGLTGGAVTHLAGDVGWFLIVIGVPAVTIGILHAAAAIAALRRLRWGYGVARILVVAGVLVSIVGVFAVSDGRRPARDAVGMALLLGGYVAAGVMLYLTRSWFVTHEHQTPDSHGGSGGSGGQRGS